MNLDEFEAAARAATPGPWTVIDAEEPYVRFGKPAQFYDSTTLKECDARYIAACTPERILALIRVARASQEMYRLIDDFCDTYGENEFFTREAKADFFHEEATKALRDLDAL